MSTVVVLLLLAHGCLALDAFADLAVLVLASSVQSGRAAVGKLSGRVFLFASGGGCGTHQVVVRVGRRVRVDEYLADSDGTTVLL